MVNFRRAAKKVAVRVGKRLKQRYFKGKGFMRPNMRRIARDVALVKTLVNSEKEIYTQTVSTSVGAAAGQHYLQPIINIAEGSAHGQRAGESVKLHGFRWNQRVLQQGSRANPGELKAWLVRYIGPRGTTPNISTFLKPDFDGLYTVNSDRNEDWYTSWEVISYARHYMPMDQITNGTAQSIKKKYGRFTRNAHQRYGGTLATDLLTDQIYLIAVCDGGSTATNLGFTFDSQLSISFYDN